jgi:translocation and assembly module TamA
VFLPAVRDPWFDVLRGWRPVYDARYERTDIAGELTDKVRFGGRLMSQVRTDEQSVGVAYLIDRQRIGPVFTNDRQALIATYSYIQRRLDDLLSPRRGYVAGVELGAGPAGLVNATHIGRVVVNGTWLTMVGNRWQPILRGKVGQVFGPSRLDIPGDLLFRAGGDQSVRGYAFDTLGVPQGTAIVGGKVTAVASAELVYWFRPQWGAAVFTDAGNATDSWSDFRFAHGSGVGARWRSPIGPASIDLALNHDTGKPRLHFSIGYGF